MLAMLKKQSLIVLIKKLGKAFLFVQMYIVFIVFLLTPEQFGRLSCVGASFRVLGSRCTAANAPVLSVSLKCYF